MAVVGSTYLQTVQYVVMLYCFQSLTSTVRIAEEFYLDKHVGSMMVANTFDEHHRSLRDIRRRGDLRLDGRRATACPLPQCRRRADMA